MLAIYHQFWFHQKTQILFLDHSTWQTVELAKVFYIYQRIPLTPHTQRTRYNIRLQQNPKAKPLFVGSPYLLLSGRNVDIRIFWYTGYVDIEDILMYRICWYRGYVDIRLCWYTGYVDIEDMLIDRIVLIYGWISFPRSSDVSACTGTHSVISWAQINSAVRDQTLSLSQSG